MTLQGANFTNASVAIDRTVVSPLSLSEAEIRLRMPAHDNGYAIIRVSTASGSAHARYLYLPPALRDLAPGFITTVAGVGAYAGEYSPATTATIDPMTVAFFDGETFIAEPASNRISRISREGILMPFAGNGFSNGPVPPEEPTDALGVAINFPRGIAFDGQGNAYIPDSSYRLWRVSRATGLIETLAGTGRDGYAGEGVPARGSMIGLASYVAAESDGTVYFIDFTNARVRRISKEGVLSTYIGTGTYGFSGDDGPATQAQFNLTNSDEGALALDPQGNLYLADTGNDRIRRVDKRTGIITSLLNTSFQGLALRGPRGVAVATDNTIAFTSGPQIFEYRNEQIVRRYGSTQGFSEAGTPIDAVRFSFTPAVAFDPQNNIVVSDTFNRRVWRLNGGTGLLETIAGIGPAILNERGRAVEAVFSGANGDVASLPNGDLLIADTAHNRVRRVDVAGNIDTVRPEYDAPTPNFVPDGGFAAGSIETAADGSADLSAYDSTYALSAAGVMRRTAGNGSPRCRFSGDDGPALAAEFCQAWDVTRDPSGNVVIADTNDNRVRRVDRFTGVIRTIAGSGATNGNEGYGHGSTCGDGGPATSACLNTPYGVAYDDRDNLFISENEERIRKVDANGIITTFATGRISKMTFWRGYLYALTDTRFLRFAADGTPAVLAGTGHPGFSGDGGPATAATIFAQKQSAGVAIDNDGNLFFTDADNLRVRAIRYGAVLAPVNSKISATASGVTIRGSVLDAAGRPAPSVRVEFSAPSSGATCALSSPFAITDANGMVTVNCTPNCTAGTYDVTARTLPASSTATVTFTNGGGPCRRRLVRR